MPARPVRLVGMLGAALALSVSTLAATPAQALVDPGTGYTYEVEKVVVPIVFPHPTSESTSYTDTFLACRSGCTRKHMGQDLMGAKMTPVLAAFDGTITSLKRETKVGEGNYVVLTADRGAAKGWSAIYVHMNNDTPGTDDGRGTAHHAFAPGIERGTRVLAGQLIGWRGDSGNGENTAPHIHFELRKTTPEGKSGWGGIVYNPYPSLQAARQLARALPSGPHPDGSLVRQSAGQLWVIEAGAKRALQAENLGAVGRSHENAIPITAAEAAYYPTGSPVTLRGGVILRDDAGLWLTSRGTRIPVTQEVLADLGYRTPTIHTTTPAALAQLPEAPFPASAAGAPPRASAQIQHLPWSGMRTRLQPRDTRALLPGMLVRQVGSGRVFLVDEGGRLRPVTSRQALVSHGFTSADVAVRTSLPRLARGAELGLRDGTLVQRVEDHRVGVSSGGAFRVIRNAQQLESYSYTGLPRLQVSTGELEQLRVGELAGP